MNIFSHTLKTALCAGLALASASLWAQQPAAQQSEKPVKPYGSNPNIFHVWAYKTQEGVLGTAKKVGGAAERAFVSEGHEVAQHRQLHRRHSLSLCAV